MVGTTPAYSGITPLPRDAATTARAAQAAGSGQSRRTASGAAIRNPVATESQPGSYQTGRGGSGAALAASQPSTAAATASSASKASNWPRLSPRRNTEGSAVVMPRH